MRSESFHVSAVLAIAVMFGSGTTLLAKQSGSENRGSIASALKETCEELERRLGGVINGVQMEIAALKRRDWSSEMKAAVAKVGDRGTHKGCCSDKQVSAQGPAEVVVLPAASRYGLKIIERPQDSRSESEEHLVVLIHGLDDPGIIWNQLIPHLHDGGHHVAKFEYPNDGPIADAADLLAAELQKAREQGVKRIDIVAHSMGGLVARDVLTRPEYYAGDGSGGERYPTVDRLIMAGTPNHGAPLARLRIFAEMKDQAYQVLSGRGIAWDDGRGEAAIDLLPDSAFLRDLNRRPAPSHTKQTLIAARVLPIDPKTAAEFIEDAWPSVSDDAPSWMRGLTAERRQRNAAETVKRILDRVGDICVPFESAAVVEGIDDVSVVRGQHVTMLSNFGLSSRTPPAIPIILERLEPGDR